MSRRLGERMTIGLVLDNQASLAAALGDHERAARLGRESLDHYRAVPYREGITSALRHHRRGDGRPGSLRRGRDRPGRGAGPRPAARPPGQHRLPARRARPHRPRPGRDRTGRHALGCGRRACGPPSSCPPPAAEAEAQARWSTTSTPPSGAERGGRAGAGAGDAPRRCRRLRPRPRRDRDRVIKYLGSKRRLVPVVGAIADAVGARTAPSICSPARRGWPRSSSAGAPTVTAVDSARYAEIFARCYIATDAADVDRRRSWPRAIDHLERRPGPGRLRHRDLLPAVPVLPAVQRRADRRRAGQPSNATGGRHPLVPGAAHEPHRGGRPGRLDHRRADGVREALVGPFLQPARAAGCPDCWPARAGRSGATPARSSTRAGLGPFDLAYLDPPYNQHRYAANYHIWETLVAWDAPEHYGVACKRIDLRDPNGRSRFNRRRQMPDALAEVIERVPAPVVVLSYNDESWIEPRRSADHVPRPRRGRGPGVRLAPLRRCPHRHLQPERRDGSASRRASRTSSTS